MVASEGCSVSRCPSRSTVTGTGVPAGWARIAAPSWSQLCTGWPASATILSPVRKPALTAGDAGSALTQVAAVSLFGTHGSMAPMVDEETSVAWPMPKARMNSSTKASRKCMNEPGAHHDHPLPARLAAKGPRLVRGVHIVQRGHTGDLDVAASPAAP